MGYKSQSFPSLKPHLVGLDILRLVAAFLVMFLHVGFWGWAAPYSSTILTYGRAPAMLSLQPFTHFGWVGVEIFFIISGLLIVSTANGTSAFSFLKSRIVRLLPGLLICSTLTLLLITLGGYQPFAHTFQLYLNTLFFLPLGPWIDGVYWTLAVEITFYVLIFVLLLNGRLQRLMPLLASIGLISSGFWAVFNVLNYFPVLPWYQLLFQAVAGAHIFQIMLLQNGCMFALGGYIWYLSNHKGSFRHYVLGGVIMLGCLLEINGNNILRNNFISMSNSAFPAIIIWLAALAFMLASIRYNAALTRVLQGVPLRNMGFATYLFYLLHNNIGVVVFRWMVEQGLPLWPALIGSGLLVFGLCYLLSRTLEISAQAYLKAWFIRRETSLRLRHGKNSPWFIVHTLKPEN